MRHIKDEYVVQVTAFKNVENAEQWVSQRYDDTITKVVGASVAVNHKTGVISALALVVRHQNGVERQISLTKFATHVTDYIPIEGINSFDIPCRPILIMPKPKRRRCLF